MNRSLILTTLCVFTPLIGAALYWDGVLDTANAGRRGKEGFTESSLRGSFASSGRADGFQSRSTGVTTFDGRGGVTRVVLINANDGEGGRRLIRLVSQGSYTVEPDGRGTIAFVNEFESGSTSEVTFDFVVSKSSRGGWKGAIQAEEITGIQREPGVTASLIEEYWTRRKGV